MVGSSNPLPPVCNGRIGPKLRCKLVSNLRLGCRLIICNVSSRVTRFPTPMATIELKSFQPQKTELERAPKIYHVHPRTDLRCHFCGQPTPDLRTCSRGCSVKVSANANKGTLPTQLLLFVRAREANWTLLYFR